MKTLQLFRIYHSFIKKWYLLLYLFILVIGLFATLIVIQQLNQDNDKFRIGVVDKDQSPETQIILKSLGDGANLGKDISLKSMIKK